mgnify:FL=1
MTSPEALGIRREIAQNYGPSIFDFFQGASQEKQAAKLVRNALSELLHEAAPKTRLPDFLYSKYATAKKYGLGDVPTSARNIGIGALATAVLGPFLGGILKRAIQ